MTARPVVLVTGGADGIGRGLVEVLADRGWKVIVNDIDADKTANVAAAVNGLPLVADNTEDAAKLIEDAVKSAGRLDGLVNNPGASSGQRLNRLNPRKSTAPLISTSGQ